MQRIRLAVVGLNFGSWIIENELLQGAGLATMVIVAVCDIDAQKVAKWSTQLGVPGYTDIADVLAQPDVQAVGLFTGPVGRAGLIRQIITSGRDVMTTKPFDGDVVAAQLVLAEACAQRRVVHLNSPAPTLPVDLAQLTTWQKEYDLGQPIAYRATTWCTYREQPNGSWYDDPLLCPAAPLFRLGIYLINDIGWFFAHVVHVDLLQSRIFTQRPTADNAQLSVLYANGAIGSIYASFCIEDQQYYRCALELNFERGTLYRNVGPMAVDNNQIQLAVVAVKEGKQHITQTVVPSQGAGYQWEEFQRAILQQQGTSQAYADRIVAGLQIIAGMQQANSDAIVRGM